MSEFNEDNRQYNASDIQRYLDGNMSEPEMHAIERASLEDPFLADAIEGIQEARKDFGNSAITGNLEKLHEQILSKGEGGKVIPVKSYHWWRIAAAASVLIVCSVIAFNIFSKTGLPEEIAINDKKLEIPETVSPASPENLGVQDDSSIKADSKARAKSPNAINGAGSDSRKDKIARNAQNAGNEEEIKSSIPKESAKTDDKKNEDVIEKKLAPSPQAIKEEKSIPGSSGILESNAVIEPIRNNKSAAAGINNNAKLNYFNGRILDNNNRPVANATVQLINTNNGYLTDQDGYFKFPGSDSVVEVRISSAGYASQDFRLRNDIAINQLNLQPDKNELNEVVVVSEDQKKSKEKTNYKKKYPRVLVQDAEPVKGWVEFDKYIQANKKIIAIDSALSREVVVSFLVNQQAVLSGFKIEQSVSPALDAEALRLIKDGPSWHLLKGKKTRVIVIIRF